ncbi:MAG: dimethylarginine dimethylaminohydrolase family protein, partial [Candidatus Hodarchaeota archaeon]
KVNFHSFHELSFRDVVYWRRFQEEHDKFCEILQNEGVEVIYLNELISMEDKEILNPNLVYTRDSGTVTSAGSIQMRMANQIRTPEPLLVTQGLKKLGIPLLYEINSPGLLEGGDFVYPDENTLMIGYSTRTNEEGALQAASTILKNTLIKTIVLVPLPSWRVHLDGGLMFIDKDLFLCHPESVETFPIRVHRQNEDIRIMRLMEFINENFDAEKITITDNELYLFGANVVCLDKRKCAIYEWNERIINELKERNVDILDIEGGELSRGGGGPHCMTLPILRQK